MTWRIINAISIAAMTAGTAYADTSGLPMPSWQVPEICAKESAPGQCAAFEGEALRTVSASWAFVTDAVKQTCFRQLQSPMDRSWRLLAECIDGEAFKVRDRTAVKTDKTPGEPLPAPKPSPEAPAFPTRLPAAESPKAQ